MVYCGRAHRLIPGPCSAKPSGHQFKHSQILLPTLRVHLRVLNWLSERLLYLYTALTEWFFLIAENESVYCAVRTGSLSVTQVKLSQKTVKSVKNNKA